MLPAILLLLAWFQRGKLSRADALRTAPFFALSLAAAVVTLWFQSHRAINGAPIGLGGFLARSETAGHAIWFYLAKAVFPWNLSALYPPWEFPPSPLLLLTGAAWIAVLAGCFAFQAQLGRAVFAALACFTVSLFPVLGFFEMYYFRFSPVADQWQYLALLGVAALLAGAGSALFERFAPPRFGPIAGLLLVSLLSVLTFQRALRFQTEEALWSDVLQKDPHSWAGHVNLAIALRASGNASEALRHFQAAVEIHPDFPEGEFNLGDLLLEAGRLDEAIAAFTAGMAATEADARSHLLLGIALHRAQRLGEAEEQLKKAISLDPSQLDAYNHLGSVLRGLGRWNDAIAAYEAALKAQPDFADAHNNLGIVLAKLRRTDEAIEHFKKAVALNPRSAESRNNLGVLLSMSGNAAEAAAQYREALKLQPDYPGLKARLDALDAKTPRP